MDLCPNCGTNYGNTEWACAHCVTRKTVVLNTNAKNALDKRTWRYAEKIKQDG